MKPEHKNEEEIKNFTDFKHLVLFQVYKVILWLSNASESEELDVCETHIRVLKEMLRSDSIYNVKVRELNKDYETKLRNIPPNSKTNMELILKKEYSLDHFGLLMDLLMRKGYAIIREGEIILDSQPWNNYEKIV